MYQIIFFLFLVFYNVNGFRVLQVDGIETIFALENEEIHIRCRSEVPMAYCGFIHPTGKRYSFGGSSLDFGQCTVSIRASLKDSGQWRCHIGGKGTIGVETTQIINVKVVKDIAAIKNNISTVHGKEVTIACLTVKEMTPIGYCRFEPPNGKPFSINSDVTVDNPILNRYYFPGNKSLDRGDCAVTIRKVKYEDAGAWTCGAGLDDGREHTDNIYIDVEGFYSLPTATIAYIALSTGFFIIIISAVLIAIFCRKRRLQNKFTRHELKYLISYRKGMRRSCNESSQGSRQSSLIGYT